MADNVDAFDLSGYLMTAGVRAEDVMLCIFNCAHGRNYRADSDERHGLMAEVGSWESGHFRSAAFQAMSGQLPAAMCILTGRHWELVNTHAFHRRVLRCFVTYGAQTGAPYRPEPSTRGDRREGELGPVEDLVATVASGPLMDRYLRWATWCTLDMTELVLWADTAGGVILFLGEFTLASSRHCAQYVLDHALARREYPVGLENLLQLCRARPFDRRRQPPGDWCTYADCLQHARDRGQRQAAFYGGLPVDHKVAGHSFRSNLLP